ncbi:MAG: energy-coupling factor transporter ATPase [Actinomycetota bacterium]
MIRVDGVHFAYGAETEHPVRALSGIDLEFEPGRFVVIFGHNGSGKSTLAKHLNGLLLPTEGRVTVDGIDTSDHQRIWDVRQRVGMVFQNPDNQIVATLVEDDISFGAENLGVDPDEIQRRVDEAMDLLDIADMKEQAPHLLSGGQKQRVAIAGVLVMRPRFIVLDEPTSMLDPEGRAEVIDAALRLAHEEGLGVILITHFMSEAIQADRVVVMDDGRIVMDGVPRRVFGNAEELRSLQLDVPAMTRVGAYLRDRHGIDVRPDLLTADELIAEALGA